MFISPDYLLPNWQNALTELASSGRLLTAAQEALQLETIPDSLFDQRGSDRVVNGTVDLGAVEVQDEDPGNELPITNEPSADEQYLLELINRMRINPSEELDLLLNAGNPNVDNAISFFEVDIEELQSQWSSLTSVAPLAWSEVLKEAAIGNNDYQVSIDGTGHAPNLGQRFTDAGYNFSRAGENAFAQADSAFQAHAAFAIDWGFTPTGIQDPPGHRNSIMSDSFREVGLEVREEDNPETAVGTVIVSQEFGNRSDFGSPRLLGVVYNDGAIADDDFYTPGEGISDVVITVADQTDSSNIFTTTTREEGGYQIELPSGSYEVTFNGDFNGDGEEDTYNDVVIIEAENVKLDVDNDVQGDENQPPTITPEFFGINADSPVGTVIGEVTATDPDEDELTFEITEGNEDLDGDGEVAFTIDENGEITVNDTDDLDFESQNSFMFGVTVTDEEGLTVTEMITVNLETEPEDPSVLSAVDDLVFGTSNNDTLNAADQNNLYTGNNQITFTGAGEDLVDGSIGGDGSNRNYGGSNADELFAGNNDRLFGEGGNDTLDASQGTGNNRLYGGDDNDDLIAGNNDLLTGGNGDDRLLVRQGGNNLLIGNSGADQFWIATDEIPNSPNTITDFTSGEDAIGFGGFPDLSFNDLIVNQNGENTIIGLEANNPIAELQGVQANTLTENDFVFAAQSPQ
ncbi:cadherin domain-containing protein [Dactylococcopsis salina]|uniref:Cadherin domain-containing protein n=1 Tax=Dactylococcopsis salina (strain PCC 8305) TaxID=13035 RepID=K9YWU2_DACS8|nr:cadherin domain-containing protein [Dactylococcopsis salina]AFZ51391.1 Cadherin domain-containing protein [Dactylococcopsis salina PCC 8305]